MKLSKKALAVMINKAVVGYRIPMMSIPALAKALEAEALAGGSPEALAAIVAGYPGVEVA